MKIKSLILGAVMAVAGASSLLVAQPVAAVTCPAGSIRAEKGIAANTLAECNVEPDAQGSGLMDVVYVIIFTILAVLGLVTVGMIIMGGVQYTTSQGDPAKAVKARNTILYGVVGLVIALLAFAIVNFVLGEVFKDKNPTPAVTAPTTTNTTNTTNTTTPTNTTNTTNTTTPTTN